ncbi:hypothetical protein BWO91_18200 [Plantibacter flavus]|uniref:hypothetical protein n=1 Tax=Plantibacter flavus TaxID=150123 RepID=UPI00099DCB60|nr:hypothetical protein [Plantibacter flavus]AQX81636.1 hypothetical protein BWO91_18200 [Plantibacter flavus]
MPPTAEPDTTELTRHLPWKEVVADQPWVFRDAAVGAGVVVASGLYLWWAATSLPLRLPDGWEGLGSGIEIVAGIVAVVAVLAVVLGGFLLTQPLTERRLLRVRRFAADNGLEYRANGAPPHRSASSSVRACTSRSRTSCAVRRGDGSADGPGRRRSA